MVTNIFEEPGFAQQCLCSMIGSIRGLVVGIFMAYVSIGLPSFDEDPDAPFTMNEWQKSLFASIPFLAAIPGSIVAGPLMSRFGRRNLLWASMVPVMITWLMIAWGTSYAIFLTAVIINGFWSGMIMPVGQLYLVEISSTRTRGFVTATSMLSQVAYTLVNYIAGSFLSWKALALVNAAIHIVHIPLAIYIPESPTWLLTKGHDEKAKESLEYLRGGKIDVQVELDEMNQHLAHANDSGTSTRDLLKNWGYLKPIAILSVFTALRQFTGAFAVTSYTVDIFRSVGDGEFDPVTSTCIVGTVQLIFLVVAICITDKVGRRKLIIGSGITMGAAHLVFALYYYMHSHDKLRLVAEEFPWIPLAALVVFTAGFSLGFAPALFILMGELIPHKVKGAASGLVSIVNNIANWAVFQYYYPMKHALSEAGVFTFYGSICIAAAIFCLAFLPETKGKSLLELEQKFTKKKKKMAQSESTTVIVDKEDRDDDDYGVIGDVEKVQKSRKLGESLSPPTSFDNPVFIVGDELFLAKAVAAAAAAMRQQEMAIYQERRIELCISDSDEKLHCSRV